MASENVEIVIIAKDRASRTLKSIGDESEKTSGKLSAIGGKVGKAGRAVVTGGAAAAAGIAVAGVGIYKTVEAASDLSETMNKSKVVFGKSGDAIAKWSETSADKMGMSRTAALDAATTFGIFGKNAGKSGKGLQNFSTDLVELSSDFASFHNASPEEAVSAIGAALRGESEPIRRFGVMLDDATLKNRAMKLGLIDSVKEGLTPQQKAIAAQAEIIAQSKDAQGDFSRTSEGLANGQRRLKATFSDISATIGTVFLPVAEKIVNWALDVAIPAFKKFGEKVMPVLKEAFEKIKDTIEENRPGLERLGEVFKEVGAFIMDTLVPAFAKHLGKVIEITIKVLGKLGEVAPPLAAGFLRALAFIIRGFASMQETVLDVFDGVLEAAEKGLGWIPGLGDKIRGARSGFTDWKRHVTSSLGTVADGLLKTAGKIDEIGKKKPTPKFGAEIKSLEEKILKAKVKINDPDITKERKAKLTANIADLEEKVRDAKAKVAGVQGKNIRIGVDLKFSKSGSNTIRLPSGKVVPLATGGIVTKPTFALIGEAGPEAVVPLNNGSGVAPLSPTPRGGTGGGDLHVHFENAIIGSKNDLARYITDAQLEYKRRRGIGLGLA